MGDETRAQIIEAAMTVIGEKGFVKASMNDIVRASGLSKGGVYWHFKGKDEVIAAVFDAFFVGQTAALDEILARPETATSRLRQVGAVSATAVAEMAAQFPSSLDFYAMAAREETLLAVLRHHFSGYQTRIVAVLTEGIVAGELREVDVAETAVSFISLLEGVLLLWSVLGDKVNLAAQMEAALDLLLAGLAVRGEE